MDTKRRRSIRLKEYNYSQEGSYFVTLCTWERKNLFGKICDGEMILNEYGNIVRQEWERTAKIRNNIDLDIFIIMPNHIHGIIINRGGVLQYAPTIGFNSSSQTLGSIVRGFKSSVTKQINIYRKNLNLPVWQRNYYEHVIRDEADLTRIRDYIVNNPAKWLADDYYVENKEK